MTGHAWNDNNYEGKLLRRCIGKLANKLKQAEDVEDIIKITNAIAFAANAKKNLASYEYLDKKVDNILKLFKDREFKQFNNEALNDIKQLPGQN